MSLGDERVDNSGRKRCRALAEQSKHIASSGRESIQDQRRKSRKGRSAAREVIEDTLATRSG